MRMLSTLFFPQAPAPLSLFSRCNPHLVALWQAIPVPAEDDSPSARGRIFPEGQAIVAATTSALAENAGLFPAGHEQRLRDRLTRACGWLSLSTVLQALSDRARAHYHREQAAAIEESLDLLRRARSAARGPHPSDTDRRRAMVLSLPLSLVSRWQRRTVAK
jgi:hypothetical protein